jgi:molecular chaperone GrpE
VTVTPTDPTRGETEEPKVVVRDKRRLDPVTGEVREGLEAVTPPVTRTEPSVLESELTERTEDLLRLKAEYDNYRKRAQREIAAAAEIGAARVLGELLPALDDVDRARAHGELDPAFRAVSEHLEKVCTAVGLERFGEKGEPFDPTRHEALTSLEDASVSEETVQDVYRAGYSYAGRVLRPAQVVVATPAHGSADAASTTFGADTDADTGEDADAGVDSRL